MNEQLAYEQTLKKWEWIVAHQGKRVALTTRSSADGAVTFWDSAPPCAFCPRWACPDCPIGKALGRRCDEYWLYALWFKGWMPRFLSSRLLRKLKQIGKREGWA